MFPGSSRDIIFRGTRERLTASLPVHRGNRGERERRRRVGGERSRRSVLKCLLNLSLPSKTAHIYRQYSGAAPERGSRSWSPAKSNGRYRPSSRVLARDDLIAAQTGKIILRRSLCNFVDDKDKWCCDTDPSSRDYSANHKR